MVEVVASWGEVKEAAVGDQGAGLDLQLLIRIVKLLLEEEANLEEVASSSNKCKTPVCESRAAGEGDGAHSWRQGHTVSAHLWAVVIGNVRVSFRK